MSVAAFALLLLLRGLVAEGFVQSSAKDVVKGTTEGIKEELNSTDLAKLSADVTRGAIRQIEVQLGPTGEGPLSVSLTATGEHMASGIVRGVVSEAPLVMLAIVFGSGVVFSLMALGLVLLFLRRQDRRAGLRLAQKAA